MWFDLFLPDKHAGVCGPPRLQLGAPAAAGMLHGREGMEGTKKRCNGDFTGVQRKYPDTTRGDPTDVKQQQQQQHRE